MGNDPVELAGGGQREGAAARRVIWLLGIAIVVGALLRSYALSKESLWIDEAYSVTRSIRPSWEGGSLLASSHPLYYAPLHFWRRLFGTSEAALRSFSVVPSVVAIALLYALGARLYDRKTALVAACFMAVSGFHIFYAQEARMYALLLALLLGSMLSMDVALRNDTERKRRWPWVAYLLTTIAALYVHPYAVFFVVGENLFFVLRWRENRPKLVTWILIQSAVILAFAPGLIHAFRGMAGGFRQTRRYLILKPPQALFSFLAGDTLVPLDEAAVRDVRGTIRANWHLLGGAVAGFGLVFVAALAAVKRHARGACFFAALCLAPIAVAFLYSFRRQLFDERYVIAASPVLYLFMASGVTHAFSAAPRARALRIIAAVGSAIVVVLVCISLGQYYFHPRFGKEQWRDAARHVEEQARPGDLIVLDPGFIRHSYEYYATRPDVERLWLKDAVEDKTSPEWADALAKITGHDRMWLVRSHFPDDAVLDRLRQRYEEKSKEHYPKGKGIDVYLMTKRSSSAK